MSRPSNARGNGDLPFVPDYRHRRPSLFHWTFRHSEYMNVDSCVKPDAVSSRSGPGSGRRRRKARRRHSR
jgi:hypothetical protein